MCAKLMCELVHVQLLPIASALQHISRFMGRKSDSRIEIPRGGTDMLLSSLLALALALVITLTESGDPKSEDLEVLQEKMALALDTHQKTSPMRRCRSQGTEEFLGEVKRFKQEESGPSIEAEREQAVRGRSKEREKVGFEETNPEEISLMGFGGVAFLKSKNTQRKRVGVDEARPQMSQVLRISLLQAPKRR